ncbi:MAG: hypothetical protein JNM56_06235 [Planctomycetia bacterium]|nr:hypothetical protein [Planctomycetia bacterium]
MAKKSRLSRDQKRKAKLSRERKVHPGSVVAPYTGNAFKSDELLPTVFHTELGIHEADVMSQRGLTDRDVYAALEQLIGDLRHGPLPALDDSNRFTDTGSPIDLIVWNIRRNWKTLYQESPHPGRDNLVGVLRTLLNSVNTWGTSSPTSRGYLHFVEGFLKKQGAAVRIVDDLEDVGDEGDDEDELLEVGRAAYLDGNQAAIRAFGNLVQELVRQGETDRVANVCQQLIGEVGDTPQIVQQLGAFSLQAQQAAARLPHEPG